MNKIQNQNNLLKHLGTKPQTKEYTQYMRLKKLPWFVEFLRLALVGFNAEKYSEESKKIDENTKGEK